MITEVEGSIWYRFGADLVMLGYQGIFLGDQLIKRGNAALGSKRDHAFIMMAKPVAHNGI